jgi:hypothetical protein
MIQRALAVERFTSLRMALRLLVSAPLFAALAALLLLWQGEAAFVSRWSPAMLASVHLMVLGALTMAMAGALLQVVPVVFDVELPFAGASAVVVHALLCLGTVLLAAALFFNFPLLFKLAIAPLALAICWIVVLFGPALWRSSGRGAPDVLQGVRLALAALWIAAVLGGAMATALGFALPAPLLQLTRWHAMWALLGWVALLIASVAYQVLPMFQLTPLYPRLFARLFAPALVACLLAASTTGGRAAFFETALAIGLAGFALVTLALLAQRKQPPDATSWCWTCSMASLLAACVLFVAGPDARWRELMLGILFIFGFAWSAVTGMLYKIIPFLLWQHWQERSAGRPVASFRQILPEPQARVQVAAHACALLMMAGAAVWPQQLARPAASVMLVSLALQGAQIWRALHLRSSSTPAAAANAHA